MSAQDSAGIAPEYSNIAVGTSNTHVSLAPPLAGLFVKPRILVTLFVFLGLAVRLYRLDARGLWFDEVTFAYSVRLNTPGEVLHLNSLFGDQSPLSFFLTWLVRGLGGSEWVVRLPFVIAGALTIPAIYFLGRELARPRVGLVAALLFALSPFAVFYSQDAHPYAPLLLFTTLQMLFAYRAAAYGHWYDWAALALSSVLNLYNDYIGLITSAVVALFLTLVLLGKAVVVIRYRAEGPRNIAPASVTPHRLAMQFAFAVGTLAAITLAYLPWLPSVQTFFSIPNSGFDRLPKGVHGTFADMQVLANGFGFGKLLVALLLFGTLYVFALLLQRRLSSVLLVIWIALPLAGYWLRVGDAMLLLKVPYYSFLFPAAVVLIASGLEGLIELVQIVYSYLLRRKTPEVGTAEAGKSRLPGIVRRSLYVALLALMFVQTSFALAASYSTPKAVPQDYRGAVDYIIANSPPGSLALSLGMWGIKPAPEYLVDGINYYLWLRRSPIKTLDGSLLDEYTATHVPDNDATIWGVYALPWPLPSEQMQRAADLGLDVIPFEKITLLRQRAPRGSPAEQIDTMLEWGRPMEPGLVSVRSILNPQFGATALGENLLPTVAEVQVPAGHGTPDGEQLDKWVLWPGTSEGAGAHSLVLSSDGSQPMVNVTLSTRKLMPGKDYVLLFHYRNADLKGEQRIYLSTYSEDWKPIDTFPYAAGFLCLPNSESGSAFAFHVPSNATNAILWLRITGKGTAEFSSVEMRPVK